MTLLPVGVHSGKPADESFACEIGDILMGDEALLEVTPDDDDAFDPRSATALLVKPCREFGGLPADAACEAFVAIDLIGVIELPGVQHPVLEADRADEVL